MKTDMSGAADVIATLGACRALGVGVRVVGYRPDDREHARRPGHQARRRPRDPQRQDDRGPQHRLRGATCARRRLCRSLPRRSRTPSSTWRRSQVPASSRSGLRSPASWATTTGSSLRVQAASARAGEPTWQLPLPEAYRADIDSEVADMKNHGKARGRHAHGGLALAGVRRANGLGPISTSPDRRDQTRIRASTARVRRVSGSARCSSFFAAYEPLGSPAGGAAGGKVVP